MTPDESEQRLAGAVVLVVEDDAMQLMAMQMLLESWGCVVLPATSAHTAEAALHAAAAAPRMIISDFRLPDDVSGLDAVGRLRAAMSADVPAILQTGDTDPELVRDAALHGYALLHKPYDPNQLRTLMATLLAPAA